MIRPVPPPPPPQQINQPDPFQMQVLAMMHAFQSQMINMAQKQDANIAQLGMAITEIQGTKMTSTSSAS
eukprot:6962001-Pyramimonas_sp.AAC.1